MDEKDAEGLGQGHGGEEGSSVLGAGVFAYQDGAERRQHAV